MSDVQPPVVKSDEISLIELFQVVWNRRWLVLWITLGFSVVGVVVAFLWPKTYEATATVFPVSSSSSGLSQYAGLASLAGVDLPISGSGSGDPGKTVSALLGSRLLVEAVVRDMDLVQQMNDSQVINNPRNTQEGLFESTVGSLRRKISYSQDKVTGVISVSLEMDDPQLAQKVTNRFLELLDTLLVEKALTTTRKRTESLNMQIDAQKVKVDQFQGQMAQFQKETDLLDPKTQAGRAMEAYTAMIQQKMNLELQLATAQASYSADNPRITLLRNQVANLDQQILQVKNQVGGGLPSLKAAPENLIRYQNLARDLEIATKIYAGLLASLEQVKLEDDKDQVYIEVLDRALLPRTGKPNSLVIVLGFMGLGMLLAVFFSLARRMTWFGYLVPENRGQKAHQGVH